MPMQLLWFLLVSVCAIQAQPSPDKPQPSPTESAQVTAQVGIARSREQASVLALVRTKELGAAVQRADETGRKTVQKVTEELGGLKSNQDTLRTLLDTAKQATAAELGPG
eukprot:TRINITY_DN337_c0_g1_i2.p1 TRINITY_DN337_c0_g1~~TRINITY_DN337_c0_g1_i2.p1  ORF type:complete len:110 (-),score=18.40 TRINITY_DN337_c0_g1_i2:327-656(-)